MSTLMSLVIAGAALGASYALIALGVIVIFRSTRVFNFAHGCFLFMGAYFTHQAVKSWHVPFYLSMTIAVLACAAGGYLLERVFLRRMIGRPPFSAVMITFGLMVVIQQLATAVWGPNDRSLGDPWGADTIRLAGAHVQVRDLAAVTICTVAVALLFLFFKHSRTGLAMRASAFDQEAAVAQGVSLQRVSGLAWAIGGALGALAGVVMAAGASAQVNVQLGFLLLLAFPAMVVGGLDSPVGAVVGGLIVGMIQIFSQGWEDGLLTALPDVPGWLGTGFGEVVPFFLMVLVLLIRPYGLMGTKAVRRL